MGELDLVKAKQVAEEIEQLVNSEELQLAADLEAAEDAPQSETKWVCTVCGYIHQGDNPPEKCPLCGVPAERFKKQ